MMVKISNANKFDLNLIFCLLNYLIAHINMREKALIRTQPKSFDEVF